jgi:hypothetical protein
MFYISLKIGIEKLEKYLVYTGIKFLVSINM